MHAPWRYTLISGIIPAIPLIIIRPFLPESPIWEQKKAAGTLKRPSIAELFAPSFARTTIVTTIMFACAYGAAFGAIQHMPQIVPGIDGSARRLAPAGAVSTRSASVQTFQEVGGLIGRVAARHPRGADRLAPHAASHLPGARAARRADRLLLRRRRARWHGRRWGILFAGFFTVAQFSFWGNYLPRVYPTHLRGTGESFAANVGGRMIGTFAAWVTPQLALTMPGATPFAQLGHAAALVALVVYAGGVITSFFLPEPSHDTLPD